MHIQAQKTKSDHYDNVKKVKFFQTTPKSPQATATKTHERHKTLMGFC